MTQPAPTTWVMMRDSSGSPVQVAAEDVRAAMQPANGFTLETPEQKAQREYEAGPGSGIVEPLKSLAEHTASMASWGLYDWLLAQDEDYRKARKLRDETFSTISTAGDVLGLLTPGLGEAKAGLKALKFLSAPARVVTKIGESAGKVTERLLAREGAGAGGRFASSLARSVAQGATENAIGGAGFALSESALQDKDLTAELLLERMGEGALVGGALFGGARALGGAGRGVLKLGRTLRRETGEAGLEGFAHTKALQSFGFQGSDIKALIKNKKNPEVVGQAILDELNAAGENTIPKALRRDINAAAKFAGEARERYGEQIGKIMRRLDAAGSTQADVRTILGHVHERVIAPLENSLHDVGNRSIRKIRRDLRKLYKAVEAADGAASGVRMADKLGEMVEQAKTVPTSMGVSGILTDLSDSANTMAGSTKASAVKGALLVFAKQADRTATEIAAAGLGGLKPNSLSEMLKAYDAVSAAAMENFERVGKPTVSWDALWKLRREVGKETNFARIGKDPKQTALAELRDSLEKDIDSQIASTGQAEIYREAKKAYSSWAEVQRVASERVGSLAGNRTISLTDTGVGAVSGAVAMMHFGPIGAVAGLGGALANKAWRSERADAIVATIADRWAVARKIADEARASGAKTVGIAQMLSRGGVPRAASKGALIYERDRRAIEERQRDARKYEQSVLSRIAPIASSMPETATALAGQQVRTDAWEAANFPRSVQPIDLENAARPPTVSDDEWEWYQRVRDVVRKPTSLVTKARDGSLTTDEVNAVAQTSPKLFEAIRQSVLIEASNQAAKGRVPSHERVLSMSRLTGTPLDASMRPEAIAMWQTIHGQAAGEEPMQSQPRNREASAATQDFASRRDRDAERNV